MSDSALQARGNAIIPETATDLSAAIGKLVTFTAGVPAVSASATVPAVGIVLDARKRTVGSTTTNDNAIGILGALPGPVRAMLSATKDLGNGNARVTVAVVTDLNGGVAGDLCEVAFITPVIGS
jgi:hydrogenase maturation factor HypE